MNWRGGINAVAGAFLIAAVCLAATPLRADAISDFYRGKTFTIFIGYPPGGSYDLNARAIARTLGSKIPGNPTVIVQNMPGAASLSAANHVGNIAAQDGLAMAAVGAALPFAPMLDPNGARFDATKLAWMPSPASFVALMLVWHTSPVKTFEDLKTHEVLMSALTPGATPSFYAAIVNDVLKTKIKLVHGYDSMTSAMLAMQRGEAMGYPTAPVDSIKRSYADLVAENKIRFILQIGGAPHRDYKDVPFILDQARTPDERQIIDVALGSLKIGYPYFMGPGVPRDRVEAVRRAMMETYADPAFLAEAAKLMLEVDPVPGDAVQKIVADAYAAPASVIAKLRALYQGQMK